MKKIHWITPLHQKQVPAVFTLPWGRGELRQPETLSLADEFHSPYAMQSRPLAYWPDGSIKWTAHTALLGTGKDYFVRETDAAETAVPTVRVIRDPDGSARIETGKITCFVSAGPKPLLRVRNTQGGENTVELCAWLERQDEDGCGTVARRFDGMVQKVALEECGPLRAVVKFEGTHEDASGEKRLPFVVRAYLYGGSDEVRFTHTIIFDGEPQELLRGLGMEIRIPVAATGTGHRVVLGKENGWECFRQQGPGAAFLLHQDSCDHFSVGKREGKAFYKTQTEGTRCLPLMGVSVEGSAVLVSVKDFWQKYPMAMEVETNTRQEVCLTAWLWSKYAEPMDFGAYDVTTHRYAYGGILNEPRGIANTNEMAVRFSGELPQEKDACDFARDVQADALLVTDTDEYERCGVFGRYWHRGQADEGDSDKILSNYMDFYMGEVEQRRWYGFWDYGDVMHTYDYVRHCWFYDVGGFAWHNSELCNTFVNWLMFLRTGDYRIFRFARAMSRHVSEVDTYHAGPFAMLGSRHNVRHWGCGAKEARISMAGHHRFFYYLTGDERMGDVLDSVRDADFACLKKDPMADYFGANTPDPYLHIRVGPDWSSFAFNWLTAWERHQDEAAGKKLLAGLESLKKAPLRLCSGSTFHYNPQEGVLHYMADPSVTDHVHLGDGNYQQHMVVCFGLPELWFELCDLLQDPEMEEMMAEFGRYIVSTPEQRHALSGGLIGPHNDAAWRGQNEIWGIRMYACTAYLANDWRLMEHAEEMLRYDGDLNLVDERLLPDGSLNWQSVEAVQAPVPLKEVPQMKTNGIAQWCLNYMETSALRRRMKQPKGGKEDAMG